MASHAANLGVKVMVLPSFVTSRSWLPGEDEARADSAYAPRAIAWASAVAKQYECLIVLPLVESERDSLYSHAVIIGPDGGVIGRYRQVHVEPEMAAFCRAGQDFPVFDSPFGRIGVILGYDGMFPESARSLALAGADIIAWPSAWRHERDRTLLAVPKAEDNRVYVVCANRTDSPYPGGSLVIPPNGFTHWNLNELAPPVVRHGAVLPTHANLALSRQKLMIPKVNMVENRLPHTYGPILSNHERTY